MTTNIFDMADTWDSAGTTYNAIKMSVTHTASAAGSKLLDLLLGGSSKFAVDPNGAVLAGNAAGGMMGAGAINALGYFINGVAFSPAGFQPLDADLTALSALTGINVIYYRSAADTWTPVVIGSGLSFSGGTLTATASGGNVTSVGTPTNGQWAQWTDATHIQGIATAAMPFVQKAGDTVSVPSMTGGLTIAASDAYVVLDSSTDAYLYLDKFGDTDSSGVAFTQSDAWKWDISVGGVAANDLIVDRYDDAGALIDAPLTITRSTGQVTLTQPLNLPGDPTSTLHAATKQYVDASVVGFQPLDGDLTAIAALTGTNTIYYRSGANAWSPVTIGANLTFSGGTLAAGAVATAHGFTGHKTVDQLIASATWTKVVFGATAYNNGSHFDTATSRYIPPAGETSLTASVWCDAILVGSNVYIAIYKNGAILRFAAGNTTNGTAFIACSDNASGTDYYEAWVFASTSGGNFTVPTGNNDAVFFQGLMALGPTGPQGPPGPSSGVSVSGTPAAGQIARWTDATTIEGFDGSFTTGDVKLTYKVGADPGWVMANDGSVGNASSGATARANADTSALFNLLWTNIPALVVQDSAGTTVTRGASAAADFAANRRLVIPKALGRGLAVAGAGAALTARALGAADGNETHIQTAYEMPAHVHAHSTTHYHGTSHTHPKGANFYALTNGAILGLAEGTDYSFYHTLDYVGDVDISTAPNSGVAAPGNTDVTGSGGAMDILNPRSYLNIMIKL